MAPLTGIAFAINWLIDKLNIKVGVVKTTRMTTCFFLVFLSACKLSTMVCTPSHLCYLSNQINSTDLH